MYARLGNPDLLKIYLHGYHHQQITPFSCLGILPQNFTHGEQQCGACMCYGRLVIHLLHYIAIVCEILKTPSSKCQQRYLQKKDRARVRSRLLKSSTKGKAARCAARRHRKEYEDKKKASKGVMYSAGALDNETESGK